MMEPISNLIPTESPHHPKDGIWSFIAIFVVRDKFAVMPVFALIFTEVPVNGTFAVPGEFLRGFRVVGQGRRYG